MHVSSLRIKVTSSTASWLMQDCACAWALHAARAYSGRGSINSDKAFMEDVDQTASVEAPTNSKGSEEYQFPDKPPRGNYLCSFCGDRFSKDDLEEHKSQHCPLRPFTCQYCNHEATHQEVTKDHWPVCEKLPLPCPNKCGEEEIEQQHLKEHLAQACPLEVIKCEFSYAGCGAQLQRRLMSAHLKDNAEAHLSMVVQEVPNLKHTIQDKIEQMEKQLKLQADQIRQQESIIKMQFKTLQMLAKGKNRLVTPAVDIAVDDFKRHKRSADQWYSPPFYTHVGGYKMCLRVDTNGLCSGKGTHVSVYVYLMKGEFDDRLKWPFSGEVVVELKAAKPPHFQMIITLDDKVSSECVRRPSEERNSKGWGKPHFISHVDLQGGGFLKDNSLIFCVRKVIVKSSK